MQRSIHPLVRRFVTICPLAASSWASATGYTLWINGRTGGGVVGNYASFTCWGPDTTAAGINKKSVNRHGYNSVVSQKGMIRDALDCFCTGNNWCYIASHSAGDLMIGYALANYGASSRLKKTAWRMRPGGGSELSDAGSWNTSEPLVQDLKTTTARVMYNHNVTANVWFCMYAGARGTVYSGILPVQDDDAVAGTAGGAYCNPGDWFCNDLTMGMAASEGGATRWSYHAVSFRDDAEAYNHFAAGNWQGIVGVGRGAMVSNGL